MLRASTVLLAPLLALALGACAHHPLCRQPKSAEREAREYTEREAFLVSGADWREVLMTVPVAIWTQRPAPCCGQPRSRLHPELVYHLDGDGAFDADAIIHFLQQYQPTRVTFVGKPPQELYQLVASHPVQGLGAGLRPDQVRIIRPDDLLRFWRDVRTVVYAEDDYAVAALAATYASLIDAPLLIDRRGQRERPWPAGWRAICVGRVDQPAACAERLDAAEVARRYVELVRPRHLVAMNPRDLEFGLSGAFQPARSARPIATTFGRLSLAAPILAASRHGLLVPVSVAANDCGPYQGTSSAPFDDVRHRLSEVQATLFHGRPPRTLALVGSPQAIASWRDCGQSYAGAADWQYGAGADGEPDLDVGRISSLTVSDTSAYVARAVFYGRLVATRYGAGHTALAIAAPGFAPDQDEAQEIQQHTAAAGYAATCFTADGATAQPACGLTASLVDADFQGRQLVTFADHGSATSWAGTLRSDEIPWLDLPATVSLACQTNDFWGGGHDTFGPTWLRRGGLSYFASVPSTDGFSWELWWAQALTGPTRPTLGALATGLYRRTDYDAEARRQYILLGDPALTPRSKEVAW